MNLHVKYLFLLPCILISAISHSEQSEFYFDEVRSLSELPMTNLIRLKSNLAEDDDDLEMEHKDMEGRMNYPMSLPLKKIDYSIKRHGEHWDEKGDTKISKIFQLTITTLSFLAFGGYLLCLVITAIRRNSATPNNVIVLSSLQKYTRPKRGVFVTNPMDNDFDTDKFYRGMIMLSQGYALYNKNR